MGTLIGIVIVFSLLLAFMDGLSKGGRKKVNNNGCLGCFVVFGILILIGILSKVLDFFKAHPVLGYFLVGVAIIVTLIIVVVILFAPSEKTQTPQQPTRKNKRPKTYYGETSVDASITEFVGKLGEDEVCKAIRCACEVDSRHYKILRNIYIPKRNGTYTEIDVLLLHESGIYVFESKNISGNIYGELERKHWLRYRKNGEKDYMVNPIKQNEGHINALRNYLKQNKYEFPAFSLIVFGEKSELLGVPEILPSYVSVHKIYRLEMELLNKLQAKNSFYNAKTIDLWSTELFSLQSKISEQDKTAHKERISKKYS